MTRRRLLVVAAAVAYVALDLLLAALILRWGLGVLQRAAAG